mmetsp:Transcript_27994/g.39824  ORF Transcript_27994/g.39824 Transcript_27994/m.39824 type:complete len:142 (-) Transcript_27994:947-1372(-)
MIPDTLLIMSKVCIVALILPHVQSISFARNSFLQLRSSPYGFSTTYNYFGSKTHEKCSSIQLQLSKANEERKDESELISGFILLNAVAMLWGSQHVVIKSSLTEYPSTSILNMWRFAASSLLFVQPIYQSFTVSFCEVEFI